MKVWRVILAAIVIFAAGAVTGGFAVRFAARSEARPERSAHPSSGHRQRGDLIDRMERELQLNASQRQNIEQILRESQEQMKQLWETIAPRVTDETRQTRQRIKAELTPEQAEQFDEHFKHRSLGKGGYEKSDKSRVPKESDH